MVDQKATIIELSADSDLEFFLIHGYTGSPTDFNRLPYCLNEQFNANVKVITLKGHGTKIEDLDDITYEDLMQQLTAELSADIKKGKKIILGGVSLGALFALLLAARYPIKAIFNICPPYLFKFPFNIKGIGYLGKYKKYWKKIRKPDEQLKREGTFSYSHMHANGLKITKAASADLKKELANISCPILTIHSLADPIGHYKSLRAIQNNVRSFIKKEKLIHTDIHNLFYSTNNNVAYQEIINFISNDLSNKEKTVAIIPTYNEAERIRAVLEAVSNAKLVDEIIVVDDGSTDDTEKIVKQFEKVKYLKNQTNLGKAESMDRGAQATDADIIFFCDADLIDIKPEIIDGIIGPVKQGQFNMFIGLRENFMQKTVHLFAINSGERALRRIVWEKLPHYFKYKYRVEAGLNYYVKKYFGGFGCQTFNYSQPTKEMKYGVIKGTILRWAMNMSVLSAYIKEVFGRL
ncbi:MAG: alpha/beta fold hydrolase [bacterium]